jgi:membrane fusion protein, multidrug efflux system
MTKNKIFIALFVVVGALAIFWRLQSNKQEIGRQASLSLISHDYLPVTVAFPQSALTKTGLQADGIFMPNKEMWVLSETQGHIQEVYKSKGDHVRAGDALAKIDDEILQIEIQTVQLNLDKLQKDKQRLANLIDADAVAKNKIEEVDLGIATAQAKIKGLQKQINNTTIRAPMDGIMTYRVVEKDGVIGLGIQVAQLTDISSLVLTVRVPELDVQRVKKGQTAVVVADAYPQRQFQGRIRNIGIKADQAFTYDIEVEVRNSPDLMLKAGMHGRAQFEGQGNDAGIFIPLAALIGSRKEAKVFVVEQDSIARLKSITVIAEEQGLLKIASGSIQLTDAVITSGNLTLTNGQAIKVVNSKE